MAEEVSLYQDTNIHVTNVRAMLQGKTYAMANVTSVSMFTQQGNKAPGLIIAVFGGLFLLVGIVSGKNYAGMALFGFILLVVGIAVAVSAKDAYWVRIGSASGETNALRSDDRDCIWRIVQALNDAIVRRG